jgi:hypothetical protein
VRAKAAVVAVSFVSLLGCGDQGEASPVTRSTTISDCGSYDATHRSTDETFREQQRCLIDAFEVGAPATLAYRYPSEEGAPIAVRLEVVGPRLVEVETDTRQDSFAVTMAVTSERCRALSVDGALLRAARCQ